MNIEEQKQKLLECAQKLEEYSELIEPLFQLGSENLAPGTDWWCCIAGMRHINLANIRFLKSMSNELERPKKALGDSYLDRRMLKQRENTIAAHEVESPCGNGCLLTWKAQQIINET